ncbi:SxtJ family membrane protein, partial [Planctomycetota bacterium]
LCLLAGWLWWREKTFYYYFFIAGACFLVIGTISSILLKPIYIFWMALATVLGWFMTRVILSILFFLVFTPMGLLMKLMGKDLLDLKYNRTTKSYWVPKPKAKLKKSDYERQF